MITTKTRQNGKTFKLRKATLRGVCGLPWWERDFIENGALKGKVLWYARG